MTDPVTAFKALHVPGDPLMLFNIWDAGSARAVARAGAKAIATGSYGVAEAQGFADGEDFSIDDLARVKVEPWTGVRNYQARNFMRAMQLGDGVLFYPSNAEVPGVYGLAEVASAAYPDPSQFDRKSKYFDEKSTREQPRWDLVDVRYVRKLKRAITLDDIRGQAEKLGEDFALIRKGNRLSVLPVTAAQWKTILSLE